MPNDNIARLIKSIREHRERFVSFCRSLSDEELRRPVPDSTWLVKDFVAHLGTLDIQLARWFNGIHEGRTDAAALSEDGRPFDIDAWNNAEVDRRRDWPLDKVLAEADSNREKLIEVMGRLEDADGERVVHFSGDNKRDAADIPFKLFLTGWARHDPIHVADMLKALPERADDPELRQWLDDPAVKWYQSVMSGPPRR
jgi:hypothetical protein